MQHYRLYHSQFLERDQKITLTTQQQHYLVNVLRFKPRNHDKTLSLFNENDGEWQAELTFEGKQYHARLTHRLQSAPEQPIQTMPILCFAPIRKSRLETLLEKTTELGVMQLQPIHTQYTQFSLNDKKGADSDRATKIVRETTEQCERLSVPIILPEISFTALLNSIDENTPLLCFVETGDAVPAPLYLAQHYQPSTKTSRTAPRFLPRFLIGPEGGFSPTELQALQSHPHVQPLSLGTRILKSETAAMVALTLWQACCGDFIKPRIKFN